MERSQALERGTAWDPTAWDPAAPWGNRVADLWRRTYATAANPLEGMNLGWPNQAESTAWIRRVIEGAEDYKPNLEAGADPEDIAHLVADESVPHVPARVLAILAELPPWVLFEDVDAGDREVSVDRVAGLRLYEIGRELAAVYIEGMLAPEGGRGR